VLPFVTPGHRYEARFRAFDADGVRTPPPLTSVRFTVRSPAG
jgi:hypothetical protein